MAEADANGTLNWFTIFIALGWLMSSTPTIACACGFRLSIPDTSGMCHLECPACGLAHQFPGWQMWTELRHFVARRSCILDFEAVLSDHSPPRPAIFDEQDAIDF